jgi:hypothetical protein
MKKKKIKNTNTTILLALRAHQTGWSRNACGFYELR